MSERISVNDTAKMARADLKKAFPATKFSVRGSKYSGGSSIDVSWDAGPTTKQVKKVIGKYHGAEFDGMDDSKHLTGAPYQNDYIFTHRELSDAIMKAEMKALAEKYHLPDSLLENPERFDQKLADAFHMQVGRDICGLREAAWASLGDRDLTPGKAAPEPPTVHSPVARAIDQILWDQELQKAQTPKHPQRHGVLRSKRKERHTRARLSR